MADVNDSHQNYVDDPRIPCKYGVKCYQKNPIHLQKYKHPAGKKEKHPDKHIAKKFKADTKHKVEKIVTIATVSHSDDSSDECIKPVGETCKNIYMSNDVSESDETNSDMSDSDSNCETNTEETINKMKIDDQKCMKLNRELEVDNDIFEKIGESNNEDINKCKAFIKENFFVTMPHSFYNFWNLCKKLKSSNPQEALKEIGLILVGPFDVLAGKFLNVKKSPNDYLIHWRYFRDPPEFQTVLKGDDKFGYHIGYFRDSPSDLPLFLCSNKSKKDGVLLPMGGNIFASVNFYLEELKKSGDPFKKMHITRIQTALKKEADVLGMDMSKKTDAMVDREKKIVTRSLNKIGLVVPYDKKTQVGYRELALNNRDLNSLLSKIEDSKSEQEKLKYLSELQPVFTFANIATDECDFGTGIELGWNMIAHGITSLNSTIKDFLVTNYRLLNKEAFAKIAEAHMNNRKQGCNLSIL